MRIRVVLSFAYLFLSSLPSYAADTPIIGFLNTASKESSQRLVTAFQAGLADAGRVEGRNVTVDYQFAEGDVNRMRTIVEDFKQRKVDLIVASGGSPAALQAKAVTSVIPIVFQVGVDPVAVGLVDSLARPSGNITGATMLAVELGSKRLEILREVIPTAKKIAFLVNPASPGASILTGDMEAATRGLGLKLHVVNASSASEIDSAFSLLSKSNDDALVIGADPLFNGLSAKLAGLAVQHRLPAIYQFHEFAEAGGLISYGGSITDAYRQAGSYAARILSGDKPSALPIQQSTKLELIINAKTAKILGIAVSPSVIARADEVVE